jgi:hypothetical protein
MSVLEFSNNGLFDSLTHAPAPAVFHANLSRAHAAAVREERAISILSLKALPSNSVTEVQLIETAKKIQQHLRHGEFFSRISEDGYWIAVRGDSTAAHNLGKRILAESNSYSQNKDQWRARVIEFSDKGSLNEWIQACDLRHFGAL